jgi:hypothetical protein
MFSYFANHSQNIPIGTLTLQELYDQILNPDHEPFSGTINLIQKLRAEPDEARQKLIKGKLLAFTPNATISTKDKSATPEQKDIHYSGFMQIDIDLKENPNMTDASAIRDKLAQIPYIALSALSARGKGVWALLALSEPDKFTQYIEPVAEYFHQARITIDKSKSKNPTELRYFSPDSGAILKTDYKLFPLIPLQPKPKPKTAPHSSNPYSAKPLHTTSTLFDLQQWVTRTTGYSLVDGQKHYYIFWLSYALRKNGTSETDVYSTIHTNILSADQIKSNCISGGIAHANAKGLYTPPISHPGLPIATKPPAAMPQTQLQPNKSFDVQSHQPPTSKPAECLILQPSPPADTRHDYFAPDGILHIHYPDLPDLI